MLDGQKVTLVGGVKHKIVGENRLKFLIREPIGVHYAFVIGKGRTYCDNFVAMFAEIEVALSLYIMLTIGLARCTQLNHMRFQGRKKALLFDENELYFLDFFNKSRNIQNMRVISNTLLFQSLIPFFTILRFTFCQLQTVRSDKVFITNSVTPAKIMGFANCGINFRQFRMVHTNLFNLHITKLKEGGFDFSLLAGHSSQTFRAVYNRIPKLDTTFRNCHNYNLAWQGKLSESVSEYNDDIEIPERHPSYDDGGIGRVIDEKEAVPAASCLNRDPFVDLEESDLDKDLSEDGEGLSTSEEENHKPSGDDGIESSHPDNLFDPEFTLDGDENPVSRKRKTGAMGLAVKKYEASAVHSSLSWARDIDVFLL